MNVFDIGLYVVISIFVIGIIYMLGTLMARGNIQPLIESDRLAPTNNTTGIQRTQYMNMSSHLSLGLQLAFYIMLATPFVYLVVKLLYEREETSVSWR